MAARGSWRGRRLALLAFLPCAATVALSIHILCEYEPQSGGLTPGSTVAVTLYLPSPSSLHSVLPRWQRGVPKPELLLAAR